MTADLGEFLPLPPGADPALFRPRPDVEAIVHAVLRPLTGVTVWSYAAEELAPRGWLHQVEVQVDVRASTKERSWQRADMCRRAVCALPWQRVNGGVIVAVDVVDGPSWLPDPDGRPRYTARYALRCHPPRAS
jgi:hypothetical protein